MLSTPRYLASERTSECDATGLLGFSFDKEHDGGGQLVVRDLALFHHLDYVDGIPRSLHGLALFGLILSCHVISVRKRGLRKNLSDFRQRITNLKWKWAEHDSSTFLYKYNSRKSVLQIPAIYR